MKKRSAYELDMRGFAHHLLLPVLAIIAVGAIGTAYVALTHAATVVPFTGAEVKYSGPCTSTSYTTANSKSAYKCVEYAQILLNGIQHQGHTLGLPSVSGGTFKYGSLNYLYMDSGYGTATADGVKAVSKSTTLNSSSWELICDAAVSSGLTSQASAASSAKLVFTAKATGVASGEAAYTASPYTNRTAFINSCGSAVSSSSSKTTTTKSTTTGSTKTTTSGSSSSAVPYASALSAYKVLSQSFTASQMISGNWAQDANNTEEGGGTCPTSNATYDSANSAVKLSTKGTAADAGSNTDCGHIRSASLISTNGTVVESKIWLPSNSNKQLIDWASYWTDGTNWPATGELDAVETQYGASYTTYHYGSSSSPKSVGTASWDSPKLASTAANDAVPGWNTVDMEFESNYAGANVYINGKLYTSVPATYLAHNSQYINWGISGPNLADPNHASWPSGAGYEEIQYLKVFTK